MSQILKTLDVAFSTAFSFMVLALILAIVAWIYKSFLYKKVFALLGIIRSTKEMIKLSLYALFVNVTIPTGGLSVAALYASDAKKKNDSTVAAVTGMIIGLLLEYASIAILLIISLFFLVVAHALTAAILASAFVFLVLAGSVFMMILLSTSNPEYLKRVFIFLRSIQVWFLKAFKKKSKITNRKIDNFISELQNANKVVREDPRQLILSLGLILFSHALYIVLIYVLFLSIGLHPFYRVVITGFAIGQLFMIVSPSPNGVGFVEASMILTFRTFGVPTAAATSVAILYRGFSFWLPLFLGFALFQRDNLREIFNEGTKEDEEIY